MACTPKLPLGLSSCDKTYGNLKMLGISNTNISYASYGAAQSIESVRAILEEDATYIVTKDIQGYEPVIPEAKTEENSFGEQSVIDITAGSIMVYLKSNPDDHNNYVQNFKDGTYYVEPFYDNGYKELKKNDDGTYSPMRAKVTAVPVGTPTIENKWQQYRLMVTWLDGEVDNTQLIALADDLIDYRELMPQSWNWEFSGSYSGTSQSILVWLSGSDKTSLMTQTPTARIISYNVDTPAVSAGAPTAGVSVLTITKESTPVALVEGEFITFVLESKTGDEVDYTTGEIIFTVKG